MLMAMLMLSRWADEHISRWAAEHISRWTDADADADADAYDDADADAEQMTWCWYWCWCWYWYWYWWWAKQNNNKKNKKNSLILLSRLAIRNVLIFLKCSTFKEYLVGMRTHCKFTKQSSLLLCPDNSSDAHLFCTSTMRSNLWLSLPVNNER